MTIQPFSELLKSIPRHPDPTPEQLAQHAAKSAEEATRPIDDGSTRDLPRSATSAPCPNCNGYSDEAECTDDEVAMQSCGRRYACCISAFVCRLCGTRFVARLEAPEMD